MKKILLVIFFVFSYLNAIEYNPDKMMCDSYEKKWKKADKARKVYGELNDIEEWIYSLNIQKKNMAKYLAEDCSRFLNISEEKRKEYDKGIREMYFILDEGITKINKE